VELTLASSRPGRRQDSTSETSSSHNCHASTVSIRALSHTPKVKAAGHPRSPADRRSVQLATLGRTFKGVSESPTKSIAVGHGPKRRFLVPAGKLGDRFHHQAAATRFRVSGEHGSELREESGHFRKACRCRLHSADKAIDHAALGSSNKQIAEHLHLSTRTVKRHITDILKALGVPDRASAAVTALRRGLIE
jgi:hypothetical protein